MDKNNIIESGGFYFIHNFDSGNLGHVERVPTDQISNVIIKGSTVEIPDYEFNLWTRPDCAGTEFENQNRTWFYFGIQASEPNVLVKLNLLNLNKQTKMYNQGMAPVTRTLPGKPQWERIRDRPVHSAYPQSDENAFTLSFKYRTSENVKATTFFAFTYPYSFAELQIALNSIDMRMLPLPPPQSLDDIYYHRECLIYSLEGRRVDLLTISSHHGLTSEREERLQNLFPDNHDRAFKFKNKKVIFISARVHPGETPSSFVFNGFLNVLLNRHDQVAIQLRRLYVFKMVPFLNPDGVARGHYRTDTRGVNLNRVYLNPSLTCHPTVYAARALIRYYHFGFEMEDNFEDTKSFTSRSIQNISECSDVIIEPSKKPKKHNEKRGRDRDKSKSVKGTNADEEKSYPFRALSTEAATLAEQVCDLKLQESDNKNLQLRERESKTTLCESPSILNDNVLRSCLGSEVHVSTSEELNLPGPNPLRPLRDALKNSISLLMECNSVSGDSSLISPKDSRQTNMKLGFCQECRIAVTKTDNHPSLSPSNDPLTKQRPKYHGSIEKYREHQLAQYEGMEREAKEARDKEAVHFCTNCFKKYKISETEEKELETESSEQIRLVTHEKTVILRPGSGSASSVEASAGDSGSSPAEADPPQPGSTGDALQPPRDSDNTQLRSQRQRSARNPMRPKNITDSGSIGSNAAYNSDRPSRDGSGRGGRRRGHALPARPPPPAPPTPPPVYSEADSGLFLYIDLHGHASKKGIFMYGNHFEDLESSVECMLLPRIMSLNNMHFHFSSCNFTERNMYLKDRRDGMSREGSGRVAVLKATGLVRSYTLECNYNTGRMVNVLPPRAQDPPATYVAPSTVPPKYTPHIYEEGKPRLRNMEVFEEMDAYEVGKSLASSILDVTGHHPNSRIPNSEHRTLAAVRDWLRAHTRTMRPQLGMPARFRPRIHSPTRAPLYPRPKPKPAEERKENYVGAVSVSRAPRLDSASRRSAGSLQPHPRAPRKPEAARTTSRTKYLVEAEPKPKSLTSKRRSVLGLRKPNASKSQVSGVVKPKTRSQDLPVKLSKRALARGGMSSSSSGSSGAWARSLPLPLPADALKRRPFPPAPPATHLKKIRLKTLM